MDEKQIVLEVNGIAYISHILSRNNMEDSNLDTTMSISEI